MYFTPNFKLKKTKISSEIKKSKLYFIEKVNFLVK